MGLFYESNISIIAPLYKKLMQPQKSEFHKNIFFSSNISKSFSIQMEYTLHSQHLQVKSIALTVLVRTTGVLKIIIFLKQGC